MWYNTDGHCQGISLTSFALQMVAHYENRGVIRTMDIHAIRNKMMLGASVYQLDLRVVYCARVSTEKDEQINSLENHK